MTNSGNSGKSVEIDRASFETIIDDFKFDDLVQKFAFHVDEIHNELQFLCRSRRSRPPEMGLFRFTVGPRAPFDPNNSYSKVDIKRSGITFGFSTRRTTSNLVLISSDFLIFMDCIGGKISVRPDDRETTGSLGGGRQSGAFPGTELRLRDRIVNSATLVAAADCIARRRGDRETTQSTEHTDFAAPAFKGYSAWNGELFQRL